MITARFVSFLAVPLVVACGGSSGNAQSADEVNCPEGQTFDGEFCQVDQSVATAEQPVEPEAVPEEPPEPPADRPQAEPEEKPGDEVAVDQKEEPEVEAPTSPAQATPVDVTMAAQAAPLIQYMASSHLPSGARPLGSPFAGQFAEGQILEKAVQLTSGKCYTVVSAGLPPVGEVNVELFAEGSKEPVAKDEMSGLQAVLGSRNKCFQPAETGAFRLVLTVARGQGIAAAQVFQK